MKNLKIGAKIMLGFGIVIALMLIIAVVVIVSNVESVTNVDMVSYNSTLQTLSADLRSNFLNARVPANLLTGSIDPALYTEFTNLADVTEQSFVQVNAYIDETPELEKFRQPIQNAQSSFEAWRDTVETIGKLNEERSALDTQLAAAGGALIETTDFILNDQFATIATEITDDVDDATLLRRVSRLETANEIVHYIASARVTARQITGTFDPAPLPAALDLLTSARKTAEAYRDESQRDTQRDTAQKAVDAIATYHDALAAYGQSCIETSEAKSSMSTLNTTTQSAIEEALAAIDEAMEVRVTNTKTAAVNSLITVIIILILAVLLSVVMALIIMRGIIGPVGEMHNFINIVGETGRMNFSEEEYSKIKSSISKDEIGQSIESFVKMIDRLDLVASSLEKVASGDLTVTLKAISNEDTMGLAVASMVDNLNKMFAEITASTNQVSTGASQIADGAQMLAQGATEQSATVEQLSASVTQIAEQTRSNASVAEETHNLEDSIKQNAEQGAQQMSQMMQAVRDISEASQSIGKVIKIIDDIAFQTNILALNAAVEAARAGQHGKGFAVVADEVRNLAAKSAAAAKDTGELIETSIKKSEMGASISEETSQSLNRIVDGIMQSSQLVAEIAKSSREQSLAIAQISDAIDQVSQVVQQNSATSEESAAASEEMSGQAALLQQLISQFKLRSSGGAVSMSSSSGNASTGFAIG